MDFYLQPALLAAPPPMEISEAEYLSLLDARKVLNAAFSFEENFDLLVGNYIEIENSALSLTTATMARQLCEYDEMFELTSEMNRRAVNFLCTARLFVDQIRQRIRACGGDSAAIKKHLCEAYDAAFEYRFMEALRNHVQHSGSAIHGLSFGGNWQPPRARERRVYSLSASTHKRFLELDSKFKDSVLEECPDKVDFMQAMRSYVSALSTIHDFARASIGPNTSAARGAFEDAIKRYEDFSATSSLGLTAYSSIKSKQVDKVAIFLNWDDVRIKLSKRNHPLNNLSKTVTSSAP